MTNEISPSLNVQLNAAEIEYEQDLVGIPFSSIDFGKRERTIYPFIPELAESISDVGMQCPIILSPLPNGRFRLEDGGRRYRALESLSCSRLYRGATGDPTRPGYVIKSIVSSDESAWLTELVANLHREALHWMDELRLIVKAYRKYETSQWSSGKRAYPAIFGKMLGNYGYAYMNGAIQVHDHVLANPDRFKDCSSVLGAYQFMLKDNAQKLADELARRAKPVPGVEKVEALTEQKPEGAPSVVVESAATVPLFSRFFNGNSLDFLESQPAALYDHIITDPDFAVSVDRLSSNSDNMGSGVAQDSIEQSLSDLGRFLPLAYRALRGAGFLAFFYDVDHHEKLAAMATGAGFLVQRWPLIWHKTDYRSNAAPTYNFCKNIEYIMVCRKPTATLAKIQMSSVFSIPSGGASKYFNHPFAKPVDLWLKLYDAFVLPGQSVLDPFLGAGSSSVAGARFGAVPHGLELAENHFSNAVLNLQTEYRRLCGPSTLFT